MALAGVAGPVGRDGADLFVLWSLLGKVRQHRAVACLAGGDLHRPAVPAGRLHGQMHLAPLPPPARTMLAHLPLAAPAPVVAGPACRAVAGRYGLAQAHRDKHTSPLRFRGTQQRQFAACDKAIWEIIRTSPELRARHEIPVSIARISQAPAAAILTMVLELDHTDCEQVAGLAGLGPVTRQSGRWTGKDFIQGAHAALWRTL